MSLTSKVKPYKFQMGSFAPATYKAQFPYPLRRPNGMSIEEYSRFCLRQFKDFLHTHVAPEEIVAVIMEPVQGEGGFIVPPKSFVQQVVEICKRHGIFFIADEIQMGFGRTGTLFASTQFDIEPDLITLSKSLASGIPISAVTGRAEIMDAPNSGELGGTYGGSPIGCVAVLAVIEKIEREHLQDKALEIGKRIRDTFISLQQEIPCIAEVRGLGAMCAVEFSDPFMGQPATEFVAKYVKACREADVIVLSAGIHGNVVRFLTPLVITFEQLDEELGIMSETLQKMYKYSELKGKDVQ
ncbi:4-aminobutyrate transaminase [Effusibacillus lacus]|uniref:4-aminobutyrate transaminase n=1 Tax=Effusibacillus lacus TaxID=1348429 RepID=A0A292YEL0_9BACL|nr:4-aminobutyrate aminotransferase [Effusibacillus lacus]GAX91712.1 4-aminobutyrate transaminase [Effusibacillus lacus]